MISHTFLNSQTFYNLSNMFFKIRNILKFGEGKNKIRNEKNKQTKDEKKQGRRACGLAHERALVEGGVRDKN